jgi:energy-coupling factor transporter ATP-binding protein EcfA2
MIIKIKNCNSIDNAELSIEENKLNIRYAMNGTGKSTIARAIQLHIDAASDLKDLIPFKYLTSTNSGEMPSVDGLGSVTSIAIFNDSYINQFAFKPDEILANSFEIFIKTVNYDHQINEIEVLIYDIKETFKDSAHIDQIIIDLGSLSESFGKSKSGYSEAGALAKSFGKGNKIENIPSGLEDYALYLKSDSNVKWLKWQMDGNSFSGISDNCPYCTSSTKSKKETIEKVGKEYDSKSVEHLNKLLVVIEGLGKYFADDANKKLAALTKNSAGLSAEEKNYLLQIKTQIDTLRQKIVDLKNLTFFSLKDSSKLSELLSGLKINLDYLPELDSENTQNIVKIINESLDKVLVKIGNLQGQINKQKSLIEKTIKNNKEEINLFLKCAGYKYFVDVEYADEKYKMKLMHVDSTSSVSNGGRCLSYGEKNAFSIVLFMYECLAKNPDLIVLDDPISSFDKNKKYAVVDMLFRRTRCLKDKTVIMLTHDLEPVIDITYNLRGKFNPLPVVAFLENKDGEVVETAIAKADIQSFIAICEDNMIGTADDVVKIVYLRRYYEVVGKKDLPYQLISNLLHKRADVDVYKKIAGSEILMTQSEKDSARDEIRLMMPGFDYASALTKLSDNAYMKNAYVAATSNYEKLQIFRVCRDGDLGGNDILNKFINEVFHIENDYIMQINPLKFEIVPRYIIDECDKSILSA